MYAVSSVARLTMNDDGTASGRFLPRYVSFMLLRLGAETFPTVRPRLALPDEMYVWHDQPASAHRWHLR